jgi:hypothetical protein
MGNNWPAPAITRANGWRSAIGLLVIGPIGWLIYLGTSKLVGMYAGLVLNESGQPISIASIHWLKYAVLGLSLMVSALLVHIGLLSNGWSTAGLSWKSGRRFGMIGLLAAIFISAQFAWLLALTGITEFQFNGLSALNMLKFSLAFLLLAIGQEMVFRGVVIPLLPGVWNSLFKGMVAAVLFGIFQWMIAGNTVPALAGGMVAGILPGISFIFTRNLWFGIFFTTSWYLLQGMVLGFPVNGITIPSLFINTTAAQPWWISGMPNGAQASLLVMALQLATAFFLYRQWKPQPAQSVSN